MLELKKYLKTSKTDFVKLKKNTIDSKNFVWKQLILKNCHQLLKKI